VAVRRAQDVPAGCDDDLPLSHLQPIDPPGAPAGVTGRTAAAAAAAATAAAAHVGGGQQNQQQQQQLEINRLRQAASRMAVSQGHPMIDAKPPLQSLTVIKKLLALYAEILEDVDN
jgi:hypothetical protein